jgi:hypothetical protein
MCLGDPGRSLGDGPGRFSQWAEKRVLWTLVPFFEGLGKALLAIRFGRNIIRMIRGK